MPAAHTNISCPSGNDLGGCASEESRLECKALCTIWKREPEDSLNSESTDIVDDIVETITFSSTVGDCKSRMLRRYRPGGWVVDHKDGWPSRSRSK